MRWGIGLLLVAVIARGAPLGAQDARELAALGHAALERRDPRVAMEHFAAGLRLDSANYAASWGMCRIKKRRS